MSHPLMNTIGNVGLAGSVGLGSGHLTTPTQNSILSTNQWPSNPAMTATFHNTTHFQVEKVDNGFVLRSGNKVKICKDVDELKDFFVSIMVEYQLDK